MRKYGILGVKLLGFLLTTFWVLVFLWFGLTVFVAVFEPGPAETTATIGDRILEVWYLVTLVLVGMWAALKGFKLVGRWEKPKDEGESEEV